MVWCKWRDAPEKALDIISEGSRERSCRKIFRQVERMAGGTAQGDP